MCLIDFIHASFSSPHLFWAKELPILKDNDFINEGQKIYIDDSNKKVFLEKLKKDVEVRKIHIKDSPTVWMSTLLVFRSFWNHLFTSVKKAKIYIVYYQNQM